MNALTNARLATARMWARRDKLIDQVLDHEVSASDAEPWIAEMAKAANILDALAGHIYEMRNRPVEEVTLDEQFQEMNAIRYCGTW